MKTYKFEAIASELVCGYVDAETKEEAIDLINNGNYDDILDTWNIKIEDITSIGEEKDG